MISSGTNNNTLKQSGFSLIEMSIALIIIGLLTVPLATLYKNTVRHSQIESTKADFARVVNAVRDFIASNNRYPLPSRLSAVYGDSDYGLEYSGSVPDCTTPTWFADSGICQATGGINPIIIGAVPFDRLGIPAESSIDSWGYKLIYAIDGSLTDAATYAEGAGEINLMTVNNGAVVPASPAKADMLILSTGPTARGGYTTAAVQTEPCVRVQDEREDENCDMDNTFIIRRGVTGEEAYSNVEGENFFDDLTYAQNSVRKDEWRKNQNALSDDITTSAVSRVGVGTSNPESRLHVSGRVQAEASLLSDSICDNDTNCFQAELIAGTMDSMNCDKNSLPHGEAVVSIGNSQVYCASPVDPDGNILDGKSFSFPDTFGKIDCTASDQLMAGIDTNGDPICISP